MKIRMLAVSVLALAGACCDSHAGSREVRGTQPAADPSAPVEPPSDWAQRAVGRAETRIDIAVNRTQRDRILAVLDAIAAAAQTEVLQRAGDPPVLVTLTRLRRDYQAKLLDAEDVLEILRIKLDYSEERERAERYRSDLPR